MIEFARPDGKSTKGYYAPGTSGDDAPGVVLIEEWWGVTPWIKSQADALAEAGFRVVIPDLFGGKTAMVADEAQHLMTGLDFGDAANQDARGAADYLASTGSPKVGVMGYCVGGALALISAMHGPNFSAAVTFYGLPPAEAGNPGSITMPLLGHWAKRDSFFTAEQVRALEEKLKAGHVSYEFYEYDADHGFCNTGAAGNAGLGHYDEAAAKLAWQRTLGFLNKNLS